MVFFHSYVSLPEGIPLLLHVLTKAATESKGLQGRHGSAFVLGPGTNAATRRVIQWGQTCLKLGGSYSWYI